MKSKRTQHKLFGFFVIFLLLSSLNIVSSETLISENTSDSLQKVSTSIKKIHEDNALLKKVIDELDTPLTGVEEIIRQEKIRMLISRLNRNIEQIEELRKEQERQIKLVNQQKQISQQSKLLQ